MWAHVVCQHGPLDEALGRGMNYKESFMAKQHTTPVLQVAIRGTPPALHNTATRLSVPSLVINAPAMISAFASPPLAVSQHTAPSGLSSTSPVSFPCHRVVFSSRWE